MIQKKQINWMGLISIICVITMTVFNIIVSPSGVFISKAIAEVRINNARIVKLENDMIQKANKIEYSVLNERMEAIRATIDELKQDVRLLLKITGR